MLASSFGNSPATRTPAALAAFGLTALLLLATLPVAAAQTTTALPPLGMSVGSIAPLVDAGAAPRYGSYWVGDWMADSGWGGFDSAMKTAKTAGVTPVVYWYYWGDSIAPTCFDADGCNGRTEAEWNSLTDQLAARLKTTLSGSEALVVLENEFNKGGITGDYAPTFDTKLEKIAIKLNAVSGVKLVVGFGNWGETNWYKFPKTIAQSEFVGYQMMRASTKDTEASYRSAADRSAYLANFIAEKFNKPSFLYDVALSSYPDASWEKIQAETLDAIFAKLQTSGTTGLQGVVYRSLNDHYMSPANYYGYAESHWGLRTKDGVPKPAFDIWLKHAQGSGTTPPPPPPPATQNVPGAFEAESMPATKGGKRTDSAASGGAAWNLWSNGQLSTTLVSDAEQQMAISVVALGQSAGGIAPKMEIHLGSALLGSFDVAPGAYRTYTVDAAIPTGSSTLAILFTNDAVIGSEDRNLIVDVASVAAAAPPPPPPPANEAPSASFTATANGLTATFDASASSDPEGAPLSYAWSFGDAGVATGVTASRTYAESGTYTVTLTVSDGALTSTASQSISVVRPNRAPLASFSSTASGLTANVDGAASSDADGDALSYAWTFGDGNGGSGMTASHAYSASGDYLVTLTVSDGELSSTASQTVAVVRPNAAPVAAFTATATHLTASFDGAASSDADGDALSYAWSFGDGASASGAKATRTYAAPGSYQVTLTVSDGKASGTKASTITVTYPAPIAKAATSGTGSTRAFDGSASADPAGGALSYAWSFGDGASATGATTTHAFTPGTYAVKLTVTDRFGQTATDTVSVTIARDPYAVTFTPTNGNAHWVQVDVSANAPTTAVCVRINGGACQPLTLKSWGDWAGGLKVPSNSRVTYTATSSYGETATSATYLGSSATLAPTPMTATFTPHDGNNYWVQTKVDSNKAIASVCASVDGGACKPLALKSWGSWAASFYVRTGAKVVFVATSTTGEKATSASYSWPVK